MRNASQRKLLALITMMALDPAAALSVSSVGGRRKSDNSAGSVSLQDELDKLM